MKNLLLIIVLFISISPFAQSDYCTSAPVLAVGTSCTPSNFNVLSTYVDNFTTEPSCGTDFRDGFFQFTATTTTSTVTLTDATPLGPDPGVMVLSGTCASGSFTEIACINNANGSNEVVSFPTTVGQTYFIVIYRGNNANANDMTGTICVTGSNVPDEPCSAQNIPVGTTCTFTSGNNSTATSSPVIDPGCGWYSGSDVWYSVTIPASGSVTIQTQAGTLTDADMAVYNGSCNGLLFIDCDDLSGPGLMPELTINGQVPGTTIWIRIWGYLGATGSFGLCVTEAQTVVTASDCNQYVDVCTDLGFQIDANGVGLINEIPPLGSLGNPDYDGFLSYNPWGTANYGCLRVGESNSTWMVVNVLTGGNLEFTFGGNGTQTGYYDWIMYPYNGASTCTAISNNTLAPVRCNWNGVSYGGTGLAGTTPLSGDPSNFEPPLAVASNSRYIICFSNFSSATTNVPLQFGGTAVVSCQPLGLTLTDFEVNCEENEHHLTWKTNNEVNFSHFEIQRYTEDKVWEIVSEVHHPKSVSGLTKNYEFINTSRNNDVNYYRLKMIDLDGSSNYSDMKSVICTENISLNSLVPNPSQNATNLTYFSKSEGTLNVIDQTGRSIQIFSLPNTEGKITQFPIDVNPFKAGIYYFVMNVDGKTTTLKFVKD